MNNYKLVTETIQADRPLLLYDTDREYLARLFHTLGYTCGAEIGVGGGVYSDMLCRCNPDVRLYCIDAWAVYPQYQDFTNPVELEDDYQRTLQRMASHKGAIIVRKYSMDAVSMFADGALDFVYIDANHDNPHVGQDIREWSKKVRKGGIVSGHDYIPGHRHVITEVDAQCQRPLYLVGRASEGNEPMTICSWFWVKK